MTDSAADTVAAVIRRRLASPEAAGLLSPAAVREFYQQRAYAPAWSQESSLDPKADILARAVQGADAEGLHPQDYRLQQIEETLIRLQGPARGVPLDLDERASLELLLTDAFLTYGDHLAHGRVDPQQIHSGWSLPSREVNLVASLEQALRDGRIEASLGGLAPATPAYVALRRALERYRSIGARGGWHLLPAGPTLRPGDRSEAVVLLRARLGAEMSLARADSPAVYDRALAQAVLAFQRTHGLREDAAVGPATRTALNVDADARAEQISLSLERLRWVQDDLGGRYIRVSIPAFELGVIEAGNVVLSMRIVGGQPNWRTPIFSAEMTSVVLSPYWNIPASIAAAEVLPRERRDPGYMARSGIRAVSDGAGGRRLRQDPGPLNPLGGVKFIFPNPYNTYLHDTPSRTLFSEPMRAFSHGCMRVEKPLELAMYLLGPLGWSPEEIRAGMARRAEQVVALETAIPVHVLYQTAWVDADGRVQFRDDIYGHDRVLAAALRRSRPVLATEAMGECEVVGG